VYPHWFVVRVRYADLASPWHATGAGYVLFTQAAQGAAWKNALEPYLLTGSAWHLPSRPALTAMQSRMRTLSGPRGTRVTLIFVRPTAE
jgi:hypothetical protein